MPAVNPRITITLKPELHVMLKRLSALTGNSQSAMVAELLESSAPVFERMVTVLEAAERLQSEGLSAPKQISESLSKAQARLEQQFGQALEVFDQGGAPLLAAAEVAAAGRGPRRRGGRPAAASEEGSTPVPVTRGSGTTPSPAKGAGRQSKTKGVKGTERGVGSGSV